MLEGIAQGLAVRTIDRLDLTPAKARTGPARELDASLTLIGTPVHSGRVPIPAAEALRALKAARGPAVLVVVYGNRAYDDALLELREIAEEVGFRPIAAAAFVGEHSFSTAMTPLAAGRPDAKDIEKARSFGALVRGMVGSRGWLRDAPALDVPGNLPYRDRVSLDASPDSMDDLCTGCGRCEEVCPQEAIALRENRMVTDKAKCLLCCACMKQCPTGARQVTGTRISRSVQKLLTLCRDRKEPEFFFAK